MTHVTYSDLRQQIAIATLLAFITKARKCSVPEVEGRIKELTEQHATGNEFISSQALEEHCCWELLHVTGHQTFTRNCASGLPIASVVRMRG